MSRYKINGIEMPGVTTVLDLLDKSAALKSWAVNCTIQYIKENVNKQYYPGMGHVVNYNNLLEIVDKSKYEYKNVSERAKNTGSIVHDLINQYINAKINHDNFDPTAFRQYNEEAENAFLAFLEWEKENIVEYIESEQPVCSLEFCFAGTLDLIAKMKNGKIYVIDFKSSKGFYDGYGKQIAAYLYARMEKKDNNQFECEFNSDNGSWTKTITQIPVEIEGMGILRLDKITGLPEFKDYTKQYKTKISSFLSLLDFYYNDKKRRLKGNCRV